MREEGYAGVAHLVHSRAQRYGDDAALSLWEGGDFVDVTWTGLWDGAARVANALAWLGLEPGDHILLLVTDIRPAVLVQLGVWARGCSSTQLGLPFRLADANAFVSELSETVAVVGAKALVVSRAIGALVDPQRSPVPVLMAEDLMQGLLEPLSPASIQAPALVQLTSGSTGRPRGVEIPHDRLLLHLESISRALPATPASKGVTWLPLHHDMGMIGGLLYALYNRFVMHVMSPLDFRGRPMRWLEALSRTRSTHTLGPPSAYAICLRLASRAVEAGLDLSHLTCAMVGAEPISAGLLRDFADAFAPCGFRPEAFFPVYGLAEATVAVTFPSPMAPRSMDRVGRAALEAAHRAEPAIDGEEAVEFVGVGRPLAWTEVRVVEDGGQTLPERSVGEVLVRSATLMTGYRNDPSATAAALPDGWLRTGDLGYLAGGELFITGRKKELIIKGGRNLIPAVLEDIVAQVPGIRPGGVAVVGVRSESLQTEQVYVVAETREPVEQRERLERSIHAALQRRGFVADHLRLVEPGTLPKTTSGKVKRLELAARLSA